MIEVRVVNGKVQIEMEQTTAIELADTCMDTRWEETRLFGEAIYRAVADAGGGPPT